ncbi:MAG: gliding motility-associated C-terminal domain-containing protein [Taibaiella sp.]|nr:gliding motility-associated C-terminal domain-containing protein [Taibaiella sp.]
MRLSIFTFILSFIGLINIQSSSAQYTISIGQTAEQLANTLVGEGVEVTDASLDCNTESIGVFEGSGDLGIDEGVVLSSGEVLDINSAFTAWGLPSTDLGLPGDDDLNSLIAPLTTHDACIFTFDFIPSGDTVRFNYVFASAEYGGYSCSSVNDVFGFFISGDGYTTQNLAVIPGTSIPICVNSTSGVGDWVETAPGCTDMGEGSPFTEYYIDNTSGDYIKFGGFTTIFTAIANVIPCQTYTLKIGIADAGDGILDSGVFIEAGSLNSKPSHEIESAGGASMIWPYSNVVRGCAPGSFTISKTYETEEEEELHYTLEGTAVNGVDYEYLDGIAIIPPGATSVQIPIIPISSPYLKGTKTVVPIIYSSMACMPDVFGDTIYIYDSLYLESTTFDTTICSGQKVHIDLESHPDFSVTWEPSPDIEFSPDEYSVYITPNVSSVYQVKTNLIGSGCPNKIDQIKIDIVDPVVKLKFDDLNETDRLCILDTIKLYSEGAETYRYYDRNNTPLGAGDSLDVILPANENLYVVVGTDSAGCKNKDSLNITAFPCCEVAIPSAFSPNGDGVNDEFGLMTDGIPEYYQLEIYDRWGKRVFVSYKVENQWDGTMENGEEAQGGVYFYVIQGRCNQGENFKKKGDLTLLR